MNISEVLLIASTEPKKNIYQKTTRMHKTMKTKLRQWTPFRNSRPRCKICTCSTKDEMKCKGLKGRKGRNASPAALRWFAIDTRHFPFISIHISTRLSCCSRRRSVEELFIYYMFMNGSPYHCTHMCSVIISEVTTKSKNKHFQKLLALDVASFSISVIWYNFLTVTVKVLKNGDLKQ